MNKLLPVWAPAYDTHKAWDALAWGRGQDTRIASQGEEYGYLVNTANPHKAGTVSHRCWAQGFGAAPQRSPDEMARDEGFTYHAA